MKNSNQWLEKSVGPIIWKSATNDCTDRLVSQLSDPPGLYAKNSHHWCEKVVGLTMQKSLLALERWALACFGSRWEIVFPGRLQKQACRYVLDLLRSPGCWIGQKESRAGSGGTGGEEASELRGAGAMTLTEPRPIKDYCLGIYDGPHATPQESLDGPIFLGIKNITDDGRLDLSDIRHVSEEEFPKWTRRVTPQANDVVFTYEATLHRYALIPHGFRGCLGRRVALVRPDPNQVDSRYLLYFFLSDSWRKVVEGNMISGATVDRIPIEKFPGFPVALPSLLVQRKVADILSAYDDLIENNQRRMALLEEAARQLYQEWFVCLRFPGHEHTRITHGVPEG